MSKLDKFVKKFLFEQNDNNLDFKMMCRFLEYSGFEKRVRGSHHIFAHPEIREIINLQPQHHLVKEYQARQVRQLFNSYRLQSFIN
ncbi:MAG: type II toxin-antitoxin system HicA family toxin [Leptospirales bacterium]